MTLQEAIKKAGPGGKIRRGSWSDGIYVTFDDWGCAGFFWNDTKKVDEDHGITQEHILATDWEVVSPEPDIQVGDIVSKPGCDGNCDVMRVEKVCDSIFLCDRVRRGKSTDRARCICEVERNDIVFISRPDKPKDEQPVEHVFEGVEIWINIGNGGEVYYPSVDGNEKLLRNLHKNQTGISGIKYTMTLKEESQ
jgi:hypothetical protein